MSFHSHPTGYPIREKLDRLLDQDGCADVDAAAERQDVRVVEPHAPVRDVAGDQLGLVRSVDPDLAAAGPVGPVTREGAGAERERAVDGRRRSQGEPLADVVVAGWRG